MTRETVPAYNEDSRYYAPVFFGLVAVIGVVLLFNPFGWGESAPAQPDWKEASCYKIPEKWGGRLYCSDEKTGGNHGYVNPGSMEWEVE